jgi:hypothetical protein
MYPSVNASAAPTAVSVVVGLFRSLDPVAVSTKASEPVPVSGPLLRRPIRQNSSAIDQSRRNVVRAGPRGCGEKVRVCLLSECIFVL